MRLAVAIIIAAGLAAVGIGMLRSLGGRVPAHAAPQAEPEPVAANVRITFWCETCGTEVLLLRKGSENPPRHCGEPMTRREEVARG